MAAFSAWATTMPPKTRPCSHHFGLVVVKVGLPWASGPASRAVMESTSSATVAGTTSASSASSSATGGSARPAGPSWDRDLDLDGEILGGQVHAAVVLGVAETLDVEEPDLGSLQRERPPVPGAPVQHQGLEGLDPEGTDGGQIGLGLILRSANSTSAGATTMTAGTFNGIRAWVWVSCRNSISQRRPRGVSGTSARACPIRFTWASAHSNVKVSLPSLGSTSATGSQPNGDHAASVSGTGTMARSLVHPSGDIAHSRLPRQCVSGATRPNLTPESV